MGKNFYVISFESTHYAMMIEKRLKEKFRIDLIPTPRSITASCGLSLKIDEELFQDVINTLKLSVLDPDMFQLYLIKKTQQGDEVTGINWDEI